MPTNHHYEKGNDKLNFSAHNFLKVVLVKELSAGDFYH